MKKERIMYSLIVLTSIGIVFVLTASYLFNNFDNQGTSTIKDRYYDILFSNVSIDFETSSYIKTNNEENTISVFIPDLTEFKQTKTFSVDLTNIGNIDASIDDYYIVDFDSNIDKTKVNIEVLLNKETVLIGGGARKVNIKVTYSPQKNDVEPYYNFTIKFIINEKDK
ncbi:MAG: hypothetical protein GX758_02285 [Tenericutes bacterium]|nr:hypothetical protein [Mycoplasmatota bacterium]